MPQDIDKREAVAHAHTLLKEGQSLNSAARAAAELAGVTRTTILRWAESLGEPLRWTGPDRSNTKNATAARVAYAHDERLAIADRLLAVVATKLEAPDTLAARDLASLATAIGIGIDKRRLEEGESTERHDWGDPGAALERGRERVRLLRRG